MKIMTVLGTRPEIIRLSLIIRRLDEHADHVLVHTGQNYDDRLNGLFFRELGLREPDVNLGAQGTGFGERKSPRAVREPHPATQPALPVQLARFAGQPHPI